MVGDLDILLVSFYYHPDQTGVAPYSAGLGRGLVERGHRVRAVVGYPHYPQWRIADGYTGLRRREVVDGVEIVHVRHPVPRSSTGIGRIGMEAVYAVHAATIRGPRPDVVLAVSPSLLGVATALRWRKPGRTAVGVIVQDLYGRAAAETGAIGGRGSQLVGRLEAELLSRADGVSVIHEMFRPIVTGLGVDPARVTTIRNWSHIADVTTDRAVMRRRLGWPQDEVIALHSGNMGQKQGLENVVEAARLADAGGRPIRFVLLGHGARRAALEALGTGVRRLEFVDPLPAGDFENALAAADVLVLNEKPGVAEMCVPSKLTSYFAAARPIVAAVEPHSGAAAEMRAAGAGCCVRSGDPAALLEAALRVGGDETDAARMGAAGLGYARRVLSPSTAIDAYEAWGRSLAASSAGPGPASTDPGGAIADTGTRRGRTP